MAFFTASALRPVVCASKYTVLRGSASAASRSVVTQLVSRPWDLARSLSLSTLRPTRTGSGMMISPSLHLMPPSCRMATMERIRCWFVPIRPVTPFMMTPTWWTVGWAVGVMTMSVVVSLSMGGEVRSVRCVACEVVLVLTFYLFQRMFEGTSRCRRSRVIRVVPRLTDEELVDARDLLDGMR
jgi:hypothetical protein